MANKKITQLTASSVNLAAIDLVEGSINNGAGVYTSKNLTGQQVFDGTIVSTPYISAYSLTNQTFGAGAPTEITFDGTGFSNFINLPLPYQLRTLQAGFYQLDFTATILNNGGNANFNIGFYLQINASDVADSSRFMNAPTSNHHISFQTSWLVQMGVLDVVTIICYMEKTQFELITESALTGVSTPSAQVIMKRIG
jgi:hypothetical protein